MLIWSFFLNGWKKQLNCAVFPSEITWAIKPLHGFHSINEELSESVGNTASVISCDFWKFQAWVIITESSSGQQQKQVMTAKVPVVEYFSL